MSKIRTIMTSFFALQRLPHCGRPTESLDRKSVSLPAILAAIPIVTFCTMVSMNPQVDAAEETRVIAADPHDIESDGQAEILRHFPWDFELPETPVPTDLPDRMLNEPFLEEEQVRHELPSGLFETNVRCFKKSVDREIQVVAAEHLARMARMGHVDLNPLADTILERLTKSSDRQLRWGYLSMIRDGDLKASAEFLTDLARTSEDDVCRLVDPLLVKWNHQPAIEVWESRLSADDSSMAGRALACRSLKKIKSVQSADFIARWVDSAEATYQLQTAAANAVCFLNPELATTTASKLKPNSMTDKLVYLELLDQPGTQSMDLAFAYCNDANAVVARAAWEIIEIHAPQRLLPLVNDGTQHSEAAIRQCCARLVGKFPDSARLQAILPLLADPHIDVRNSCRKALIKIANTEDDLKQTIVDFAGQQLSNPDTFWGSIEQSCYLLAKLRRPEFSEFALKQCRHDRPEAYVAAAWLFHLMPEPKLESEVRAVMKERVDLIGSEINDFYLQSNELDQQIGFLLQAAGYCKMDSLFPAMTHQLNKDSGLGEHGRSAGVWAIGAIKEGSQDKAITSKLFARLNDRISMEAEYPVVRRMAAQAIGRVDSSNSSRGLLDGFTEDVPATFIPQTIRWALLRQGEPSPGQIDPSVRSIGGWRLQPVKTSNSNP